MPSASASGAHRLVTVAGQDMKIEAEPLERLHNIDRVRAQFLADRDARRPRAETEHDDRQAMAPALR